MNEYDESDNEEDSFIGYNIFLLQELKSNQHAEKNNSLSWHQTQHSLPCSYQTLNYSANNSWKPQTRHFASTPLSLEEIISKKKYSSSKSKQHQLFSFLFSSFRGFIVKQWFIIFTPTYTSGGMFSKKKYWGREGNELLERRIQLVMRLKLLLCFGKVTKYCIMFHCFILTKIKNRLLLNKFQSSWRKMKKMSPK